MDNPVTSVDSEPGEYIPFRPALTGPFVRRFYERVQNLANKQADYSELEAVMRAELHWVQAETTINPRQRRVYRAIWLLLGDLIRVGWQYRWMAGTFEIAPPVQQQVKTQGEIEQVKETVRKAMKSPRLEKIIEARDFIKRMETPTSNGISVRCLVADGASLASELSGIVQLTDETERLEELGRIVKPYLQLVNENERCSHTGYKLGDIWRYFRLTWATPAENTPGRTMLYLIRDAGRPYHPVMGIASLENAPLRIAARDNYLGWSVEAFTEKVEAASDEVQIRNEFNKLLHYIEIAICELDTTDLCTFQECQHPTPATFQKLKNIAARSLTERESALQDWQIRLASRDEDEDDLANDRSALGNISKVAEEALYRRKRAERFSQLLFARQKLNILLERDDFAIRWREFLELKTGKNIVRIVLRAQKSRHVGTSILELNVCGAIPPYNEILSGKLTALLILSPQVVADYKKRYGQRPSDIASRMKNEPVIRPAEIVFLGTTSLYKTGSSQYNRLKLPASLLKDGAPEVRWAKLGETSGYGTLHISRLTLKALEDAVSTNGVTYVNHIFGEGASPKLRAVRQALDIVLDSNQRMASTELTQHTMSRLVYGVWLASNGRQFLAGEVDRPEYYFDSLVDPQEAAEKIVDYWRRRWLSMRLNHIEALDRISKFDPEKFLVSKDLYETTLADLAEIAEEVPSMPPTSDTINLRELTRNLYRGLSAYADRMDEQWLSAIHVRTDLDDQLIDTVKSGKSVVLTGNPGDGKTHLLRILAPQLTDLSKRPVVELDASAISNINLKTNWEKARSEGRPFCVAVNEAVLKDMADEYSDFSIIQEAQRQVEQAIIYSAETEEKSEVVVFDLSRRNILSKKIVSQVLDKLTDEQLLPRCSFCPKEGCDLVQNQKLLRTKRVRDRLQALLDRVSRRGYHATLRELQALVSYLLFGGRSCTQLLQESGNESTSLPQLAYSGEGNIFDRIRETFDPASVTHPVWDDRLVGADTDLSDWLPEWQGRNDALDPNDWRNFEVRKRAFYFFHKYGNELLTVDNDDEAEFAQFLQLPQSKALRLLIARINHFFGDSGRNELRVWQSHRYSQSPRRVLYSSSVRPRGDFEIVHPRLRPSMAKAFDLAQDHILLQLRNSHQARLRVDFSIFELLAQSERGVPVLSLDNDATRRLWQFMEKLAIDSKQLMAEAKVVIFNTATGEKLDVMVDLMEKQYLEINREAR